MQSSSPSPLGRHKLGTLTRLALLAFVVKGLLSTTLILWALWTVSQASGI